MISALAPLSDANMMRVLSKTPIAFNCAITLPISWSIRSTIAAWIDIYREDPGGWFYEQLVNRAVAYLRSGRVRTDGIVTHRFGLDGFGEALHALTDDPTCLKSAIVP